MEQLLAGLCSLGSGLLCCWREEQSPGL